MIWLTFCNNVVTKNIAIYSSKTHSFMHEKKSPMRKKKCQKKKLKTKIYDVLNYFKCLKHLYRKFLIKKGIIAPNSVLYIFVVVNLYVIHSDKYAQSSMNFQNKM